jgi:hypothetical protein
MQTMPDESLPPLFVPHGLMRSLPHDVPSPLEQAILAEDMERLFDGLSQLPARTRKIISLRFGLRRHRPLTLAAIGEKLRLQRQRIHQIQARAIEDLQLILSQKELPPPGTRFLHPRITSTSEPRKPVVWKKDTRRKLKTTSRAPYRPRAETIMRANVVKSEKRANQTT